MTCRKQLTPRKDSRVTLNSPENPYKRTDSLQHHAAFERVRKGWVPYADEARMTCGDRTTVTCRMPTRMEAPETARPGGESGRTPSDPSRSTGNPNRHLRRCLAVAPPFPESFQRGEPYIITSKRGRTRESVAASTQSTNRHEHKPVGPGCRSVRHHGWAVGEDDRTGRSSRVRWPQTG